MRFRLFILVDIISIFPLITHALNDLWSSNDDSLFPYQELAFNPPALPGDDTDLSFSNPSGSAPSFFDLDESPEGDISPLLSSAPASDESIFGPYDNNNMDISSQSNLAACSASESESENLSLSAVLNSKSRKLRRGDGGICRDPTQATDQGSGLNKEPKLDSFREVLEKAISSRPGSVVLFLEALQRPAVNTLCYVLSFRVLPWGVCSSPNAEDVGMTTVNFPLVVNGVQQVVAYTLTHCTMGM